MQNTVMDLRKLRGWSQKKLAAELEVNESCLSRYLRGRRLWPAEVRQRIHALLGEDRAIPSDFFLPWDEHFVCVDPWKAEVDPGQTWAAVGPGYEDIYRQLRPTMVPPPSFLELVRVDSSLESLGWTQLCEGGARPILARPVLFGFPRYPLVDARGWALGTSCRAAFTKQCDPMRWILWPQITVRLADGAIRPDGLLVCILPGGSKVWAFVQIDGGSHREKRYDDRQDARSEIPVLRFGSSAIMGLQFAESLDRRLRELAGL